MPKTLASKLVRTKFGSADNIHAAAGAGASERRAGDFIHPGDINPETSRSVQGAPAIKKDR